MNQGADESRHLLLATTVILALQHLNEVLAALSTDRMLSGILEAILNLLVQLIPVRDNHHAAVIHILANPLRQPNHRKTLAGALAMPDNTALLVLYARFSRLNGTILIGTGHLLDTAVKNDAIVQEFDELIRFKNLQQTPVKFIGEIFLPVIGVRHRELYSVGRITLSSGLLPMEIELRRREGCAIIDTLAFAAGHQQLCRGEKLRNLPFLLVSPVLVDTILYAYRGFLQFYDSHGNAIDIDHHVWPAVLFAKRLLADGHLLGNVEIVIAGIFPIDKPCLLVRKTCALADRNWIAQGIVNRLVAVVECIFVSAECGLLQFEDGFGSLGVRELLFLREELPEKVFTDIGILIVLEIADVLVAVVLAQELDNPVLDGTFGVGGRIWHITI